MFLRSPTYESLQGDDRSDSTLIIGTARPGRDGTATIHVDSYYGAKVAETVSLADTGPEASCGYSASPGPVSIYVWPNSDGPGLATGLCSAHALRELSDSQIVSLLGPEQHPEPGSRGEMPSALIDVGWPSAGVIAAAGTVAFLVGLVTLAWSRRNRRPGID